MRLLGKLPYDAAEELQVAQIYLCCHVLDPGRRDDPFHDVRSDMEKEDYPRFRERLVRRNVDANRPPDAAAARALLLSIVDQKIDRLNMLAADRLAFDDAMNALKTDIMGFDDSIEGERLRRHSASCQRAMHRIIATIIKMRKDLEIPQFIPAEESQDHDPDVESGQPGIKNEEQEMRAPWDATVPEPAPLAPPSEDEETDCDNHEFNAQNPELQSKATVAGFEPQVQVAVEVQEPDRSELLSADLGPEDDGPVKPALETVTAIGPHARIASEQPPEAGMGNLPVTILWSTRGMGILPFTIL